MWGLLEISLFLERRTKFFFQLGRQIADGTHDTFHGKDIFEPISDVVVFNRSKTIDHFEDFHNAQETIPLLHGLRYFGERLFHWIEVGPSLHLYFEIPFFRLCLARLRYYA